VAFSRSANALNALFFFVIFLCLLSGHFGGSLGGFGFPLPFGLAQAQDINQPRLAAARALLPLLLLRAACTALWLLLAAAARRRSRTLPMGALFVEFCNKNGLHQ
jgi:hypothetical protein